MDTFQRFGHQDGICSFKDNSRNWMTSAATDTIQLVAPADTTPPTGNVSINSGAASTTTTAVTLTLSATDAAGTVTGMKFSNDGTNTTLNFHTPPATHGRFPALWAPSGICSLQG